MSKPTKISVATRYSNYLFLRGKASRGTSGAGESGSEVCACAGAGRLSLGDKVRALRSSGGGMGLILFARFCSFLPESGDPESLERVGGLMEDGRDDEDESVPCWSFLTDRSSGWS